MTIRPITIQLTFEQILQFTYTEAEDHAFYLRYLLIREKDDEVIDRYYKYLNLIEGRLDYLRNQDARHNTFRKSA